MRHCVQRVLLPLQSPPIRASHAPGLAPPQHVNFASTRTSILLPGGSPSLKSHLHASTPHPDPRQHTRRTTSHSTIPIAPSARIAQVLTRSVYHHGNRQGPRQARQGHPRSRPHRYVAALAPRARLVETRAKSDLEQAPVVVLPSAASSSWTIPPEASSATSRVPVRTHNHRSTGRRRMLTAGSSRERHSLLARV